MNDYRGFEAQWHDLFWAEEEASELPLMESFLDDVKGESLYLGSGSGRLLGPLHEKGHLITGVEISPEMAALSQERWPAAPVFTSSWEDFQPTKKYSAILVPAFTLQLLEKPQEALKKMRATVDDSGRLYLSLFFPWIELSGELPTSRWYHDRDLTLPDGNTGRLDTRHKIDERRATLKRDHRYRLLSPDGEILREETTRQIIRWFADGTLERMLKNSGWRIEKETANFDPDFEADVSEDDLVYVTTLELVAV